MDAREYYKNKHGDASMLGSMALHAIEFAEEYSQLKAKERYEEAYEFLKEHAKKHEWFATVDALKIASGYKPEKE